MRKNILFLLLLVSSFAHSQHSYDFATPLPPEGIQTASIAKPYFGIYSSENIDIDYEFSEEGVFAVSTLYSYISRETIRESSKYHVENDYLFGVKENDSIPCILEGEFFYFGIKTKEQIIGGTSKNILTKVSETTYILNFEDNGTYTPSLFEFKGKELSIRHFTYEESANSFDAISLRTEKPSKDFIYVTLEPSLAEWNALSRDAILGEKIILNR